MFPGQGSQYVGMGRAIVNTYPDLLAYYQEAEGELGFNLRELCFSGPEDKLKKTSYAQPALLVTSIICLKQLLKAGVKPDYLAGHSLGEYSALVAAGCLSFREAINLVRKRGLLMEEAYPLGEGGMAAVLGLAADKIEEVCRQVSPHGFVQIANYNCPGQIVIAGQKVALYKAANLLKLAGAKKVIELVVSGPFHSELMKQASYYLASYLGNINFLDPKIPVISNVSADYLYNGTEIMESLRRQMYLPVRWQESIKKLSSAGVTIFIEVGPGKVLSGLVRKTVREVNIFNVEDDISLANTLAKLKECID